MQNYTTKDLLALLVAFLEMQMVALLLKKYPMDVVRSTYPELAGIWSPYSGICTNIERTRSRLRMSTLHYLLTVLLVKCPSGTGKATFPVPSAEGVGYNNASWQEMWGDHPYADNRRKIIQECIDQLYTELQRRNVNVG